MPQVIAVIGALDTKGEDMAYIQQEIKKRGYQACMINTGVLGEPLITPHVSAHEVARAGGSDLQLLRDQHDKSKSMKVMVKGIRTVVQNLFAERKIHAVFSMGGSNGTMIGTSAMKSLPMGVPKVMVSTVASGDTSPYVGISDIVMIPSILDISGVNRISARIYSNAIGSLIGMMETQTPNVYGKPLITASMFGNTTKLVNQSQRLLEDKDYEVLVFHAVGTGGQMMDSLIDGGYITGVLDLTTTELADELVGGVMSAGSQRMDPAAKWGVPQVVAPGCMDMVNFWGRQTVPEHFNDRLLYEWNPNITLMRTTPEENRQLGRILAEKLNRSQGKVAIFLPTQGFSELDVPGGRFWWPEANQALFDSIYRYIRNEIEVYELDCNINDEMFAKAVSEKLLHFINESNFS